jgi:hypothetical protein
LVAWMFHGTARGEIQWLTTHCIAAFIGMSGPAVMSGR